jgi:equilibrative nucleoside transporter 1/2/3
MGIFEIVWWVTRETFPVPLCIVLIYIQTFMMFPGVALEKTFPQNFSTWVNLIFAI